MQKKDFFGRWVALRKTNQVMVMDEGLFSKRAALEVQKNIIICNRCGQKTPKKRAFLPNQQYYCPACIMLGRLTTQHILYTIEEPNLFLDIPDPLTWKGELSKNQLRCSNKIIQIQRDNKNFLLWAVTGAGKTEILFASLADAFKKHKRVCIASPRVDVCNELYPRLKAAFECVTMVLLHGYQAEKYEYTQLVICTTHQLLRFKGAFDMLIIDEVDAFPFKDDVMLMNAVNSARKSVSSLIMLTATPTHSLMKQVRRKKLEVGYLPSRYHGHELPIPKIIIRTNWLKELQRGKICNKLRKIINSWIDNKEPFLVFVSRIDFLRDVNLVINKFVNGRCEGETVFSADKERIEKVQKMRNGTFQYLVTTTILERGVTFAGLNILVLGADDELFNSASLVQIAGRVGRSAQEPDGDAIFLCSRKKMTVVNAKKQIILLNLKGRKIKNESLFDVPE
ncbi:helicase-related protein [Liquorilactobacillus mali]|nr:DEAD/DEAH box helicase family protein [Liquorilactobacillus mali]MDN7145793.1 helicase-related protein [Liquorilactobacillus mali]